MSARHRFLANLPIARPPYVPATFDAAGTSLLVAARRTVSIVDVTLIVYS